MLGLRIHGRGGQGAQVACQILADAFHRGGAWVQAFAAYGGERRGAPVTAALRVDDRPVRLRCDVERADHALVLDPTLLPELAPASLRPGAIVVVNAPGPSLPALAGARAVPVDLAAIARATGLGAIVSTAGVGALGGATGLLALEHLLAAVEAGSPARRGENVEACRRGWAAGAAAAGAARVA